jgi:predicted flap endonuclease-1-like 5' DNA nuclease
MQYLVLQIMGFLLIAIIGGILLGWWFKGTMVKLQSHHKQQDNQEKLQHANAQLTDLKAKYQHAKQKIEQYTTYYNGNSYSEYLATRQQLAQMQTENQRLLDEIAQQKQQLKQLQSVSVQASTLPKSTLSTNKSTNYSDDLKKIEGITTDIERQLNSLGILKYRQIAEFSLQDAEMIATHLSTPELPDYRTMIAMAQDLYTRLQCQQAA